MPYAVGFSQDEITLLGSGPGELARRAELAWGCTRPSVSELSKERHWSLTAAGVQSSLGLQKEQLKDSPLGLRELRVHLDFLLQGP